MSRSARTPPPLDGQLCFSIYSAMIAINRLYKPVLDRLSLTYTQFLVLQAACAPGAAPADPAADGAGPDEAGPDLAGRTVGAIAAILALEPSTVTPVIKRMEAAGLLARRRDGADERQVRVTPTAAGRALWAETGCLADVMEAGSGMDGAALLRLNASIRDLRDALVARAAPG